MIKEVTDREKQDYNKVARHPLQTWEWGEFRKDTGVDLSRLSDSDGKGINEVYQITWHRIPKTKWCVGYCPKSSLPSERILREIEKLAKKKRAIFVKFEPNETNEYESRKKIMGLERQFNWVKGKPLFTKYTFQLDITEDEENLLRKMQQKTRYNIRLAEKKGVRIVEDNSEIGFGEYWKLMEETTKRQKFFAHTKNYHRKMWKEMIGSGIGHLFKAIYQGQTLTVWMVFVLNGRLYYPYGASSNEHREVMANNLMMWEVIKYGKKQGCRLFDMWGSLGPDPNIKDPWYGFHKFKQGYGANLVEFLGSYDLVIEPILYKVYGVMDKIRWMGLKLLAKFRS